jgi:hypothetical protein
MKNKIYFPIYLYFIFFSISYYLFYKEHIGECEIGLIVVIVVLIELISLNYFVIINSLKKGYKKLSEIFKRIFSKRQSN